jgi:hypothetical protein
MKGETKGKRLDEGRQPNLTEEMRRLQPGAGHWSRCHPEQLGGLCSGLYPLDQGYISPPPSLPLSLSPPSSLFTRGGLEIFL